MNRKTEFIGFKTTAETKAAVVAAAEDEGVTESEFVRDVLTTALGIEAEGDAREQDARNATCTRKRCGRKVARLYGSRRLCWQCYLTGKS